MIKYFYGDIGSGKTLSMIFEAEKIRNHFLGISVFKSKFLELRISFRMSIISLLTLKICHWK